MLRQALVPRAAHFDRSAAAAIVTPMPFVTLQPLSCAAVIANEQVGLLFLIVGMDRHDF